MKQRSVDSRRVAANNNESGSSQKQKVTTEGEQVKIYDTLFTELAKEVNPRLNELNLGLEDIFRLIEIYVVTSHPDVIDKNFKPSDWANLFRLLSGNHKQLEKGGVKFVFEPENNFSLTTLRIIICKNGEKIEIDSNKRAKIIKRIYNSYNYSIF